MDDRTAGFKGMMGAKAGNIGYTKGGSPTLCAGIETDVVYAIDHAITTGGNCTARGPCIYENICPTEKASGVHGICYGISRSLLKGGMNGGGIPLGVNIQPAMTANGTAAVCYSGVQITSKENSVNVKENDPCHTLNTDPRNYLVKKINEETSRRYIVRRLTPTECCRLQGFPDWWCDGADGSDSAMYKMWGNGIALPCAADVIGRLAKELERTE